MILTQVTVVVDAKGTCHGRTSIPRESVMLYAVDHLDGVH